MIRRASPEDLDILVHLSARTFRETYGPNLDPAEVEDYVASNFTAARIAEQVADPSSTFFLGYVMGQPVGYATLRSGPAPACVPGPRPVELSRLYLVENVIGKGHGAALMRACLEAAQGLGFETMWLGIWQGNVRARAFYQKWGFKDVGTHEFIFGGIVDHDPVMARPVKKAA